MRESIGVLLSFAMCVAGGARADEVACVTNVLGREFVSLNGAWHYIVDVQEEGYYDYRMNPIDWGFMRNAKRRGPSDLVEYDFDASATMLVPGDWNTQDERLFFYEGTVWFERYFDYVPRAGRRALLYFGGVNYACEVYVNGVRAGGHEGGFTGFNFDVTDLLHEGSNFVVVKVDNRRSVSGVPTVIFDWWNYGGITRDVLLLSVGDVYIEDYGLHLDSVLRGGECLVGFRLRLNRRVAGREVVLRVPELGLRKGFRTDADGCVNCEFKVEGLRSKVEGLKSKVEGRRSKVEGRGLELWCPERPKLYRVELTMDGETLCDSIGFRTIGTRGRKILLNGEPVFLKGVCLHEERPDGGGRATSSADARRLLGWVKDLGCNFVRLAHYPHNEYMVREAERMGLMVWSEIPCYWTIDWGNELTYVNAERQLMDMIGRDRNRCGVIIWSIANETPHSVERDVFLGRLARRARMEDGTRLISMAMEVTSASNFVNRLEDNMHELVDVVAFNQYVGWYRDVNDASRMRWEIPYEKPVIVSEWGGGAKYGLHGDKSERWTEEFQENLYRENIAMLERIEGLAGTTPWILKDFRSPRRVLAGIQDFYNMKGVLSDRGEKKRAWYVLKEWYEGMEN